MKRLLLGAALLGSAALEADESGGDLRSAVQNPISSLISLPFKFTFDYGAENGEASFLNIQPVLPVTVGDWNLVNRVIAPLIDTPGQVTGLPSIPNPVQGDGATGLGDINYSLFFSPVKYDKWIWGVGPSITFPTATNDQLGTKKWSAGPTAVFLTQPKWGSMGILGRQLWSFAGDSDRRSVSQLLIEPFVNYNLDKGGFLISDMVLTANWMANSGNRWTAASAGCSSSAISPSTRASRPTTTSFGPTAPRTGRSASPGSSCFRNRVAMGKLRFAHPTHSGFGPSPRSGERTIREKIA